MKKTSYGLIAGDFFPQDYANRPALCAELNLAINEAQHFIVNLEAPITSVQTPVIKSGPNLKLTNIDASLFDDFCISDVTLANNHMMDFGVEGLKNTIEFCVNKQISFCGAGSNSSAARKPLKINLGDDSLVILNICENEFGAAGPNTAGVNAFNYSTVLRDFIDLKGRYKYVVICFHGGVEHYSLPRPGLAELCRLLASWGASLIVCHHTHTPSAYEIYENCPIYYGIGNFFFPSNTKQAMWQQGLVVKFWVSEEGTGLDSELIAVKQSNSYCVEMMKGKEKAQLYDFLDQKNKTLLSEETLTDEWLKYCLKQSGEYLNLMYFPIIARPIKLLKKFKIFSSIAFPSNRIAARKNLISCESHHEILKTIHNHYYSVHRGKYE